MTTLLVAVLSFFGFIAAYHTYGKWLARKIFGLDPDAPVPSQQLNDGIDYVPTRKEIVFGHHFTSIAGTGPIVGPAIAVFWGWLPALLWVIFGSIFIGAVHDFGALVVSIRNRGQTLGEVAGRMISPRAKFLFLLILFFSLTIVLAIFGLVIAVIFSMYPESVLSVWIEIPIAVVIGLWVYRRKGGLLWPSLAALAAMYLAMYTGAYWIPLALPKIEALGAYGSPVVVWTAILFVYCFVASVLPVWVLLQPRDFINSHELKVALVLVVAGLFMACFTQQVNLPASAPMIAQDIPVDAPPIWPFLFITIACGAISGFHCLVSSGTSSKQLASESHAQFVGYGSMLLEGGLAVVVILACCAGVGMGKFDRQVEAAAPGGYLYAPHLEADGTHLTGRAAWNTRYDPGKGWGSFGLPAKVGAFIEGAANFLTVLGIELKMGIAIMAVLVASFAATTLDTATRLQRYVIQELAETVHLKPLTNKYAATGLALGLGLIVAMIPATPQAGPGTGGLILWPLFGATNQLLAGLAFMVIVFYLVRKNKPIWFALVPMVVMLIMPAWAMLWQMFNPTTGWLYGVPAKNIPPDFKLLAFGALIMGLQAWMIIEGLLVWKKARGDYPELPPLPVLAPAKDAAD